METSCRDEEITKALASNRGLMDASSSIQFDLFSSSLDVDQATLFPTFMSVHVRHACSTVLPILHVVVSLGRLLPCAHY